MTHIFRIEASEIDSGLPRLDVAKHTGICGQAMMTEISHSPLLAFKGSFPVAAYLSMIPDIN